MELVPLREQDVAQFKGDMQEAPRRLPRRVAC